MVLVRAKLSDADRSLFVLTAGWLVFSWICHENPLATLGQPFKVANLYSESRGRRRRHDLGPVVRAGRPLVAGPSTQRTRRRLRRRCLWVRGAEAQGGASDRARVSRRLCLVSLLSIRHLAYDFVFLAPVAALAFSLPRLSKGCFMVALAYLWFGLKLLDGLDVTGKWVELVSFLTLNLMLLIVLSPGSRGERARRVRAGD